ncbi:MAG: PQQ-dependent sugar dehydrogenase [candidate division KSB1 bacterium]|nr:PQQ-dependent sugar dehydrogenase [candidate division KSB1 bacterium]
MSSSAPAAMPAADSLTILDFAIENITDTSATLSWKTNLAAQSQVFLWLDTLAVDTLQSAADTTQHTFALTGLWPNRTYTLRVLSFLADGSDTTAVDTAFTTLTGGHVVFENVQTIFDRNCVRCHQGTNAPADLSLKAGQAYDNIVNVPSSEVPQYLRIHPGRRESSYLYIKITYDVPPAGARMENLPQDEIELIGRWIDQGALRNPPPPYMAMQIRTPRLPDGEINIAYGQGVDVWGGLPPYSFSIVSGNLPPGLNLDSGSGYIAGVPSSEGTYDFTLRVSDSQSPAASVEQTYRIIIRNTQNKWSVPDGFEIQPVVTDLHLPVNIAFVPNPGPRPQDPYFYVTLLYGDIVMVQRNFETTLYATDLLNFNPTGEFAGSGELGVTGIVVDPLTGDVFASMVYDSAGQKYGKVVRFHSEDGGRTAATQTAILTAIPAAVSHQVHALTIGPDGKLYLNTGDGSHPHSAPELDDLRGKILRMNLDGSMPPDNPFPGTYIYAKGFRNPFGAAWRPDDGFLYISDNGQKTDDRLVKVYPGEDYGWRLQNPDLTTGAIYLWNPVVSPVEMDFCVNTAFPPQYEGDLFVGWAGIPYLSGQNPVGKKIERFKLDAHGQVIENEIFIEYIGSGRATVVGVAFGPDGLYFTDLFGENGFDYKGRVRGNVYRVRWVSNDSIPPVIQNVQITDITDSSATVLWETSEPARSQVEYGTATGYGQWTPLETNLTTQHRAELRNLLPGTRYHVRIWAWDASSNQGVSDDFDFTTPIDSSYIKFDRMIEAEQMQLIGAAGIVAGDSTVSLLNAGTAEATVQFPADSSYWLVLRARNRRSNNVAVEVRIDSTLLRRFEIDASPFGRFGVRFSASEGAHLVSVHVPASENALDSMEVELDWLRVSSFDGLPDSSQPAIVNLAVADTARTAASVHWTTNRPTLAWLHFGPDTLTRMAMTPDSVYRTQFQARLQNLIPGTAYEAMVTAVDRHGRTTTSDTLRFRTLPYVPGERIEAEAMQRTGMVATAPGDSSVLLSADGALRANVAFPEDSLLWLILRAGSVQAGDVPVNIRADTSGVAGFQVDTEPFGLFGIRLRSHPGLRALSLAIGAALAQADSLTLEVDWLYLQSAADSTGSLRPAFVQFAVSDTGETFARLRWITSTLTRAQLYLGTDSLTLRATAPDSAFRTHYRVLLDSLSPGTEYRAVVVVEDRFGKVASSDTLTFRTPGTPSGISPDRLSRMVPDRFALSRNYPNPFNPATRFRISLPEPGTLTLRIFDLRGRRIRELFHGELTAGVWEMMWQGRNDRRTQVSSGVYLLQAEFHSRSGRVFRQTRRLLLMK